MDNKVVKAMFEDGEITFAEPMDIRGCWRVQVTFLEREDAENNPVEANPHRHEGRGKPNLIEELHRDIDSSRPHMGPF